jgi:hypothetical protein
MKPQAPFAVISFGLATAPVAAQTCYLSTIPVSPPTNFSAPHAAYDTVRSRMIIADSSATSFVRLFAHTGAFWTQISPGGPSERTGIAMVYDSARDRIVVFGGQAGFSFPPHTWEWDGQAWQVFPGPPKFSGRAGHSMAYDAALQRTVLFGGVNNGIHLQETQEWNGTTWVTVSSATRPPVRTGAPMVYDSIRQRVVLIGGSDAAGSPLSDTWEWDGAAWVQRADGPSLSPRRAAFNPQNGRVFLFAGPPSGPQAWEYDGTAWIQLGQFGPGFTGAMSATYDPGRGKVVLAGGSLLRVWDHQGSVIPPWIVTQPEGGYHTPGFPAVVSAEAGGNHVSYQWQRSGVPMVNGGNISGVNSPQLRFDPFLETDVGTYRVVVSNACATVASNTISLTLPPHIPPCSSANCYANCDQSTGCPSLTANDFVCFFNHFIAGDSYADCDGVGGLVGGEDFICFLGAFNQGCS